MSRLAPTSVERDRMDVRAYAVRTTLEGTDRLLGLDDARVVVLRPGKDQQSMDGMPPAWTDGRVITINGFQEPVYTALRDGWTEDDIFVVTALNYHELAHCFFMPRLDTPLMKRIKEDGYWQEWNILQDMHDETMFVGRYRPATNYFVRIAAEFFARTKSQIDMNYVLVAGRRFLPDELRNFFLDNFIKPDLVSDIDRISDEYVATLYPRDEDKMYDLVKEYHELLKEMSPQGADAIAQVSEHKEGDQSLQPGKDGSTGPMVPVYGQTLTEDAQGDARERADRDQEKRQDASSGLEGSPGQGQGEEPGESESDDDEGEGAGGQHGGQGHERPSLDNILDDVSRRVTADAAQELGEKATAIDHAAQDYKLDIDPLPYREISLDDNTADAARQVERALRRLKEDFDPGWHRQETDGRLDFRRVIGHTVRGDLDVFKRWDEGVHDVLDIEAVIACDLSGSMASMTKATGRALWVIHTALKAHNAEATVLGYNTDVFLLRQRGDRPESYVREYGTGGGTSLAPAILEANKVFAASPRPLKLFFVITDGGWYDRDQAYALLDNAPYRAFIVGLGYDVSEYKQIGSVEVARTIQGIQELPSLFKDIVTGVARYRAERQKMSGRA